MLFMNAQAYLTFAEVLTSGDFRVSRRPVLEQPLLRFSACITKATSEHQPTFL
jgi:hypothetical protein